MILLDGAMGTTISNIYKIEDKCREKLNYTKPELINEIHEKYIASGVDCLKANTFNCSKEVLRNYGENEEKAYEYAFLGAEICRKVAKKYNKKSIGTFCLPDKDQIDGILDGNVDIIMIETIYNLNKGLQSLNLVKERMKKKKLKKPLMISFAVNKDGKLYSGEKLVDIYENFIDDYIVSIGINCSELTEGVIEALKKIKKETNLKVSFHPNSDGNIKKFVKDINRLLKIKVVDIVGGCCGTDFDHIKMLKMSFEEKL